MLREESVKASRHGSQVETALIESAEAQIGECIVKKAIEYQSELIVCGTHGRRGMSRLLLGSDAEYVVRHSPVPVLLVRKPSP